MTKSSHPYYTGTVINEHIQVLAPTGRMGRHGPSNVDVYTLKELCSVRSANLMWTMDQLRCYTCCASIQARDFGGEVCDDNSRDPTSRKVNNRLE